jgi:hypothetical protein
LEGEMEVSKRRQRLVTLTSILVAFLVGALLISARSSNVRVSTHNATLAARDNVDGGPHFETAAEAATAADFAVPECPGRSHFAFPNSRTVYGHFEDDDLQAIAGPTPGPISPPNSTIEGYQQFQIHGEAAIGYESDRKEKVISENHSRVSLVRSYITWNEAGARIELSSKSKFSLSALRGLAEACAVRR